MQPKTGIWGYGATEPFSGRLIWQSIKAPLWTALPVVGGERQQVDGALLYLLGVAVAGGGGLHPGPEAVSGRLPVDGLLVRLQTLRGEETPRAALAAVHAAPELPAGGGGGVRWHDDGRLCSGEEEGGGVEEGELPKVVALIPYYGQG